MKTSRWLFVAAGLLTVLITSYGVVIAQPLTLQESIEMALKRSPTLHAAQQAIKEADFRRRAARSDFFPTLHTQYSYTRLDDAQQVVTGPTGAGVAAGTRDVYYWVNTVNQPVFTWGALRNSYLLTKLGVDTARVEHDLARIDLVLQVKEAYYSILDAEESVEVAKQEVESLESQLKVAQAFYDVGIIPKNDLLQTEVQLAQSQQNLTKAKNNLEIARSVFNTLLRRNIHEPVVLVEVLEYRPIDDDLTIYIEEALDNRPEVKAAKLAIESAKKQVRIATSGLFPQVSVTFNYQREGDDPSVNGFDRVVGSDPDRWNITALADWKVWDWGRTWWGVQENKAKVFQAESVLQETRDAVRLDVKSAYLRLKEAEKNIRVAEKAVSQAEENYRINEERYKEQVATSTDLLIALTLLTEARTNYHTALSGYNVAVARLQRTVGGE